MKFLIMPVLLMIEFFCFLVASVIYVIEFTGDQLDEMERRRTIKDALD